MNKRPILVLTLATGLILMVSIIPTTAHHDVRTDERIVQPYDVPVMLHIPVIAGYEPFPFPQHCLPTTQEPTAVLYREDFSGNPGWDFITTPLSPQASNLWHVTDWAGPGEVRPESGDRLYFGLPQDSTHGIPGTYHAGFFQGHVAGTAQSPPIQLPDGPGLVLVFDTKWAVEWLKGYDHMWVEVLDEDQQVHILCTANALDRGDASSGGDGHRIGSCSPILIAPCPTGDPLEPNQPNDYPVDSLPGWETRMVQLPERLAGQEIQLRFTFDTSDAVANQFMGWMVDDVRITGNDPLSL